MTFSLVVRPDVNMHAFHGLPFVAAMGMMDALVGTASTPGLGLAGKVGIQWPSDIVCGAPAFETSFARVSVNGGAGAAGMFGAVTVDIERSALSELGVDVADEALVEELAAAVLSPCGHLGGCCQHAAGRCRSAGPRVGRVLRHGAAAGPPSCGGVAQRLAACGRCVCGPGHLGPRDIKTDAGEQEFPPEAVRIRGL